MVCSKSLIFYIEGLKGNNLEVELTEKEKKKPHTHTNNIILFKNKIILRCKRYHITSIFVFDK